MAPPALPAEGEVALSKTNKGKVLPKDINIKIDDKEKKQGEENPELTFQDFQDQLVSWSILICGLALVPVQYSTLTVSLTTTHLVGFHCAFVKITKLISGLPSLQCHKIHRF